MVSEERSHEASQHGRGMFLAVSSPTMAAPNTLTATELAQQIDAGAVTAEAIVPRPSRAHRPARRPGARLVASRARGCTGTRQGARSRTTPGPAARRPDGREGHHRFLRPADDLRLADLQDASAAGRCRDHGAGARRGRDPARQDGDDGVRQPPSRVRPAIRTIPRTRRAARRPARPPPSPTAR